MGPSMENLRPQRPQASHHPPKDVRLLVVQRYRPACHIVPAYQPRQACWLVSRRQLPEMKASEDYLPVAQTRERSSHSETCPSPSLAPLSLVALTDSETLPEPVLVGNFGPRLPVLGQIAVEL